LAYLAEGLDNNKKIFVFDIKPANILIKDGNYLIADFGTSYVKQKIKKIKSYFFKFFFKYFI
jgi:serine/threonine protein kinase